jgi:tyrosyl-DNA phosphodiesterase-1
MPQDAVISLDSDDEVGLIPVKNNKNDAPIEILSDDEEVVISDINNNIIKKVNETVSETVTVIENDNEESSLTPQQLMRQKLAEAAEKRLKRSLEIVDDIETPLKTHKRSLQTKVTSNPIPDVSSPKTKLLNTSINDRSSRIRLISNPKYCTEFNVDGDKDTVSLSDLVGSKDLIKTYQFNMLIDFEYLKLFINNEDCEFFLINKALDSSLRISDQSWEKYRIKSIDVSNKLENYGTHHTKMMVNFYKDTTCQIVVHTMNMVEADHLIQTQMCWVSPQLQLHKDVKKYFDFNQPNISIKENTGIAFKRDFIAYLMSYENSEINKLIDQVGKYDFSPIDVVFVASTPGHTKCDNWNDLKKLDSKPLFGYGRLWQVIHMLNLQSLSGRMIAQVSTIAGPCDNWKRNIFIHMLTSCAEKGYPMIKKADYEYQSGKNKLEPMIVWPTEQEVLRSRASVLSGLALHWNTSGKWYGYQRQYENMKKYLYKWTNDSKNPEKSKAGRSNLSPHVKTYTVTEDNFKTIKWFLLTSANLSHQAWGKYKAYNLFEYTISSFEAGIFVAPELLNVSNPNNETPILVPTYGKDTVDNTASLSGNKLKIGIRLPYDTPLTRYSDTDIPWAKPESDKYFNTDV